jgi:hypothetical protein
MSGAFDHGLVPSRWWRDAGFPVGRRMAPAGTAFAGFPRIFTIAGSMLANNYMIYPDWITATPNIRNVR